MGKKWFAVLALSAAVGVATPALAGPKGHGKGNSQKNEAKHQAKHDDKEHGWERRDGGVELRVFGLRDSRPPGWTRGKKAGWRDCGLPPGQAKKYGCYTYIHAGHRYFYYHDDDARIVVRRVAINVNVSINR